MATVVTEIVDDVESDHRYLACFASTRSEIVVPVWSGGRVVGELDVDSDLPAAFGEADQRLLKRVAELIADREASERRVSDTSWLVDEWGRGSFPASYPPSRWAGPRQGHRRLRLNRRGPASRRALCALLNTADIIVIRSILKPREG